MPRARWLKPEFFTDKKICEMDDPIAALVYEALWCWSDDGGTCLADPELLKSQVFFRWRSIGVPEIAGALRHLCGTGRILVYAEGDEIYAVVRAFGVHQKVHKPSEFRHPVSSQPLTSDGASLVPHYSGTPPYPRLLDSQTPRLPDSQTPPAKTRAPAKQPRVTWLTPIADVWTSKNGPGTFTPRIAGRSAKGLKPLVDAGHDPPEIARRLALYLDATESRFWDVEKFASTFGQWDGSPHPNGTGHANGLSRAQSAVQRILALVTRTQQPGQAPVVFIPKPRVVELGPEIAGAYDRVGGASRFLSCDGDKIGLLTRDFATALAGGSDATV